MPLANSMMAVRVLVCQPITGDAMRSSFSVGSASPITGPQRVSCLVQLPRLHLDGRDGKSHFGFGKTAAKEWKGVEPLAQLGHRLCVLPLLAQSQRPDSKSARLEQRHLRARPVFIGSAGSGKCFVGPCTRRGMVACIAVGRSDVVGGHHVGAARTRAARVASVERLCRGPYGLPELALLGERLRFTAVLPPRALLRIGRIEGGADLRYPGY